MGLSSPPSFDALERLSRTRDADLIVVVDEGRIVERGTDPELRRVGGIYAGLVAGQEAGDRPRPP